MSLLRRLALMTDSQAIVAARWIVEARLREEKGLVTDLSDDLRAALAEKISVGTVPKGSASEAKVARLGLVLLAEAYPSETEKLLNTAHTEAVLEIAAVTLALVILQTKVKITKGKGGKWSVEIEKAAASDSLLIQFVKSIFGL
jgi:hypothetical protein